MTISIEQFGAGEPSRGRCLARAAAALRGAMGDVPVLGGIYARLARWLCDPVGEQLDAQVLSATWDPVRAAVGGLGADAAVRGAALRAVRPVIEDPAAWIASRPA